MFKAGFSTSSWWKILIISSKFCSSIIDSLPVWLYFTFLNQALHLVITLGPSNSINILLLTSYLLYIRCRLLNLWVDHIAINSPDSLWTTIFWSACWIIWINIHVGYQIWWYSSLSCRSQTALYFHNTDDLTLLH